MEKKFFEFLESHDVYDQFAECVHNNRSHWFNIYEYEPTKYLVGAFVWEGTNEGHEFWSDLNKKWIEICSS